MAVPNNGLRDNSITFATKQRGINGSSEICAADNHRYGEYSGEKNKIVHDFITLQSLENLLMYLSIFSLA